jgi:phosphoribosylglycinamide formyltransferase 1
VTLAVLVSGTGTILQSMFESRLPVCVVVADRACPGLELATAAGAATELVDRQEWGGFGADFDRQGYTRQLTEVLRAYAPDLVAMAGFGTVLAEPIHVAYAGRILNTHPSLLPAFPGWKAVEDALAARVDVTGCTVHIATLEMDAGPVLAQEAVAVRTDDTVESLHERIKTVERRLYPETIQRALDELATRGGLERLIAHPVMAGEVRA